MKSKILNSSTKAKKTSEENEKPNDQIKGVDF